MEAPFFDSSDELPTEALGVFKQFEREAQELQQKLDAEIAAIRERANNEIAAIHKNGEQQLKQRFEGLLQQLQPLRDTCVRDGKLDAALAVHDQIRRMRFRVAGGESGPDTLTHLHHEIGRAFLFQVTGQAIGPVWGTDVYTSDSALATAAIHAGVLRHGQRGWVKVTVVEPPTQFEGSARNGVTSFSYGCYPGAYRVEQAGRSV